MKDKIIHENGQCEMAKGRNAAEVYKKFNNVFAMRRLNQDGKVEAEIDIQAVRIGLNEVEDSHEEKK